MKRRTTTPAAKAPEQDVEAELQRQVDEEDDEQDGDADRAAVTSSPGGGAAGRRGEADAPAWPGGRPMTATATKSDEEKEGQPGSRFVSTTATATIGTELADGPDGQDGRPEWRLQHAGVAQDRQQGAERRRRQAQRRRRRGRERARCRAGQPDAQRDDERRPPGPSGPSQVPSRILARSSSVPARNIRYVRPKSDSAVTMVLGCVNVEHKGPDDDAEDDLDDDLGYRDEAT